MKAFIIPVLSAALLMSACSSQKMARSGSGNYDDVYYSSNDAASERNQTQTEAQPSAPANPSDYSAAPVEDTNNRFDYNTDNQNPPTTTTTEQDGNTYITNNYYDDEDYYDYEYSSRVRRFYSNVGFGYGYYDNYFTNSYYYDYNPYSYGVSIYLGYNFWTPYYNSYTNYCYTPYSYYGYNPWYTPWYN
ncbi:MAG TPA: hypothetical protein PKD91_11960, partial [Bacteroidia bacterium]|nr:hypothetical protein [Bacteroidia bacterium]